MEPEWDSARGHPVLLYDGVCGLCNRLNWFVLRRDSDNRFRFAPLQSSFAREILRRYEKDSRDLDTVYLIVDYGEPGEHLLSEADAILEIFRALGGVWKLVAALRVLPQSVLNLGYHLVARNRYRLFGRFDSCPLPSPEQRAKFFQAA